MNAPFWFILLPIVSAGISFFIFPSRPRFTTVFVTVISLFLAWLASSLPLDAPISLWTVTIPVYSALPVLGRQFLFETSMRPALTFLYLGGAGLFGASLAVPGNRRLLTVGMVVQSLLSAALFVQPFLYAFIFLLLSVTCMVLLLSNPEHPAPRGAARWIVFTTLGMSFLLLAGSEQAFLLNEVVDPVRAQSVTVLLIAGFGLLISFPPFHFWQPDIADDSPPYGVAFVLSVYFGAVIFFLLRFLDEYSWLRSNPDTYQTLQAAGMIMCITGGVLALVQTRFGRMMGYLSLVNLGAILLCVSLASPAGVELAMVLLVTRGFSLVVWGVSFQFMRTHHFGDKTEDLRGRVSLQPVSCAAVILSGLSLAGLPGLISFPGYWAALRALAVLVPSGSGVSAPPFVLILSMVSGTVICLRFARVMFSGTSAWPLPLEGGRFYRILLGAAVLSFFVFGFLPQLYLPWVTNSARAFTNLLLVK